jgi:hypothetical protein
MQRKAEKSIQVYDMHPGIIYPAVWLFDAEDLTVSVLSGYKI